MSTRIEVRAPAEQTEGTRSQLLRWLKPVGAAVRANEPLIEIETDKVTVEVAAPASGVLRETLKHEQEEIAPGELLGYIESAAEAGVAAAGARAGSPAPAAVQTPAAQAPVSTSASAAATEVAGGGAAAGRAVLSPAVRRLLAEHGLEAADVRGSGPGGRITVEDVLAAGATTAGNTARMPALGSAAALAAAATVAAPESTAEGLRRVPHTAIRRRIAEHMVHSLLRSAPHVTAVFEADLAAVLRDRARQREEFAQRGVPLTLTAYFVMAVVSAVREVPEANSRWTDSALEIYEPVHVGIGTAVEGQGLIAPVLRDAQKLDLFATAQALHDLVTRARSGKLTPADVRGGTFTISNHGVSGSLLAAPIIINQPQSAILGVGKLEQRPVVVEEGGEAKITARPRCYVTLTIDHRVLDGEQANHFMRVFVRRLNEWAP
jgi:2-oxoglutarate dehydrogenase E2 component (dihydrolipoamide succinyltransferase)